MRSVMDQVRIKEAKHLVVFSSVVHYSIGGTHVAHGGFVREIDLWARIFEHVVVAALTSDLAPATDAITYAQNNVQFISLGERVITAGPIGKLKLLFTMPKWLLRATKLLRPETVIMARGPDSVGFLGVILTRLSKRPRFAKYAGQWTPYDGEPLGYRIQKQFYASPDFGGPIIVNALLDSKKPHVVPLLNASISRQEWLIAGEKAKRREWNTPYRLLFVGRMTQAKGIDTLLRATRKVLNEGIPVILDLVGDGPEKQVMEQLTEQLHLGAHVRFHGWLGRSDLADQHYANAFCLINCSRHQGLDKVIIEAMSYGLPVIVTNVSVAPAVIDPPRCGLVVEPDNVTGLASAIRTLVADIEQARRMGDSGRQQAASMLLDDQESKYRQLLREYVHLKV